MKKILFVFATFTLISCSYTAQQKAEKSITEYLKNELDDPSSYESVSFSDVSAKFLDFKYASIENNRIEKEKNDAESSLRHWEMEKLTPSLSKFSLKSIDDSILFYQNSKLHTDSIYKEALKEYELSDRLQDGWCISHTFRANNKLGAKKKSYIFYLNKDFSIDKVF